MIPEFPEFKKLEFSDLPEVESFTANHPPYSDFNFTSMWSWNVKDEIHLSIMNKNLIVKFTDYINGEPFYSFIGNNEIEDTVEKLILISRKNGVSPLLKLIPEEVALKLNSKKFKIDEDRNHFDYVLSIKKLLPHDGKERKLSSRRKLIQKFLESNKFEIRIIEIHERKIQSEIFKVFNEWENQLNLKKIDIEHLKEALKRLFTMDKLGHTISFGIYIDNKLAGYSINEIVGNDYAVGHFQQADLSVFSGIYAVLMQEVAPFLDKLNCKYINIEQDLGIEGLRTWKSSYNPQFYLKKYTVSDIK